MLDLGSLVARKPLKLLTLAFDRLHVDELVNTKLTVARLLALASKVSHLVFEGALLDLFVVLPRLEDLVRHHERGSLRCNLLKAPFGLRKCRGEGSYGLV